MQTKRGPAYIRGYFDIQRAGHPCLQAFNTCLEAKSLQKLHGFTMAGFILSCPTGIPEQWQLLTVQLVLRSRPREERTLSSSRHWLTLIERAVPCKPHTTYQIPSV
jgi:hypothetical protein